MKNSLMAMFVATALTLSMPAANANCPAGSHPWTDQWGNQICRDFGNGATRSIRGGLKNCPVGTHRSVDSWGNAVCQSFGGKQRYYDTSRGCPIGTHRWTDRWGNAVCKRF